MLKLLLYLFIFQIYFIKCANYNCSDKACMACSLDDDKYCFKCKPGFIRYYAKCGKECSSIMNCLLCDREEKKCIRCKSNCIFNGTYCDCTQRYILVIVCLVFTIFMISAFFFCLIHKTFVRTFATFNFLTGGISPENRNESTRADFRAFDIENRIYDIELERDFNQRKIILDKDIGKKKCYICKNNSCNLKLGCNCLICFECEKKCVKDNICLNCNKNITNMEQISCSICYANKKELSYFNCNCKNVVCKECFIKCRKQNNFCPFCRRNII